MTISDVKKPQAPALDEPRVLEEVTSSGEAAGIEVEHDEEVEIRAPFDPQKIDVTTSQRTISLLLDRLREGELSLTPDFQRRANLWSIERKSRLIESILLKIPLPSLYVSEDDKGNYTVVDGLQRLCAISHFADVGALNQVIGTKLEAYKLSGLQSLTEYNDTAFDELPRALQRRIKETELTLHIIRAGTPVEVKFSIFSRLNQGGLPLKAQEIRHAIYPGHWRKSIRALADSEEFLTATEKKIKTDRMEDAELVLRFVALYSLKGDIRSHEQTLDNFLNERVESFVGWTDSRWNEAIFSFKRAMLAARHVFGKYAFRKYYGGSQYRNPINKSLFECEAICLAFRDDAAVSKLAERADLVLGSLADSLSGYGSFSRSVNHATGSGQASNYRIEGMNAIFDKVLNA